MRGSRGLMHCLGMCWVVLLSACGGGGGSNSGSTPSTSSTNNNTVVASPASYTLSGTVFLEDQAALDSDSGDSQQTNRVRNDTPSTAQSLTTPVELLGYVNQARSGNPASAYYLSGDIYDYFSATLTAKQVVELEFPVATDGSNLDLFVFRPDGTMVGQVSGRNGYACIAITTTGSYRVLVSAAKGASLYTLRIDPVGTHDGCSSTVSSAALFVNGEVLAKPKLGSETLRNTASYLSARKVDFTPPQRLSVPEVVELAQLGVAHAKHHMTHRVKAYDLGEADLRAERSLETFYYAQALQASGDYQYAEPNYAMQMAANYAPVSEPKYAVQRWNYELIHQPEAMDALRAHVATLSTQPVRPVVAVIDTGLVLDHPDFSGQTLPGYSFLNGIASPGGSDLSVRADGPRWHGSHVAGTVAARDDNGLFGSGVAPMALVMPLRVFASSGGFSTTTSADVQAAMRFAANLPSALTTALPSRRADVINLSLGGTGTCPASYQDTIYQVRAQGVIVVAAAGNEGTALSRPANCDGVVSVGAVDAMRARTSYSNFGAALALVAPGGDINSPVQSTLGAFDASGRVISSFGPMSGTSMATPHVAGVMALMRYVNPTLSPERVDKLITQGALTDDLLAVGHDAQTGYGLINAQKAVNASIALANQVNASLAGQVIAQPASLNLGTTVNTTQLLIKLDGQSRDVVKQIRINHSAVRVIPQEVESSTHLGVYLVSVDRSALPLGTTTVLLTVVTDERSFNIPVSVQKLNFVPVTAKSTAGRVQLQVLDAQTLAVIKQLAITPQNGQYAWEFTGLTAPRVLLRASSDANGNDVFCEVGELCGTPLEPDGVSTFTSTRANINFGLRFMRSVSALVSYAP